MRESWISCLKLLISYSMRSAEHLLHRARWFLFSAGARAVLPTELSGPDSVLV